ncbi:MAG TPA: flagellar hook-length control protein FliK [Burkholderiaceae bacterium]|nr:flagellar hook-length control protein FliK [Burkholderiaceae bacterium]
MLQLNASAVARATAPAGARNDAAADDATTAESAGAMPFGALLARSRALPLAAAVPGKDDANPAADQDNDAKTLPDGLAMACLAVMQAIDPQRAAAQAAAEGDTPFNAELADATTADASAAVPLDPRASVGGVGAESETATGKAHAKADGKVRLDDATVDRAANRDDGASANKRVSKDDAAINASARATAGRDDGALRAAPGEDRDFKIASANEHGLAAVAAAVGAHGASHAPSVSAANAPVVATVPAPVNTPAFAPSFASTVTMLANEQVQSAELILRPAELGPINVQLSLSGAEASIAFAAVQPETRQAIEAAMPMLESMLAEHGLSLTQGSVSDQAPRRDGERAFAERSSNAGGERGGASGESRTDAVTSAGGGATRRAVNGAGVDLYA